MMFFNNPQKMPKQLLGYGMLLMVAIFFLTPGILRGEDLDLAKLPEIVRKAADKAVPNAKWNKAVKDTDGKDIWYDIEGIDSKGRYVCVTVEPNGDIEEIETEINPQNTPNVVLAALKDRYPNFKISAVYEIRDDDDKIIKFNFEGKRLRDKKVITVSFTGDGKFIKIDD
ncbi:MAG: hypothetical protein EBT92_13325 [Planctomycetes bacterium]|nr:hypothetical protein [Planctomycetota bacterium]NBY01624.1 hypothetical protein [Planctomycetota bacterium]